MQNLEIILTIVATAIGLLITTITFIQKFVSSEKAKKTAEHIIHIGKAVLDLISEAEKLTNLSGTEKKSFVLEKVSKFAEENNLNYDAEMACCLIEDYIKMSKIVNAKLVN